MPDNTPHREAWEQARLLKRDFETMAMDVDLYLRICEQNPHISDCAGLFQLGTWLFEYERVLRNRQETIRKLTYKLVQQGSDGSREGAN